MPAGPGFGERNWQHVKHVWDANHAMLSSDAAEKKTYVYEGVRRQDQWASSGLEEDSPLHKMWTKDEVEFDLGLDKFGVEINMDAEDERASFKNYPEDWEEECIKKKTKSNEHLLLKKYRDVRFFDDDTDEVFVISKNLEWKKKTKGDSRTPCFGVAASLVGDGDGHHDDDEDEVDDDDDDDENTQFYHINEVLHLMIANDGAGNNLKLVTE
jgi:hypothetical protein